jgi:hypothetical protein
LHTQVFQSVLSTAENHKLFELAHSHFLSNFLMQHWLQQTLLLEEST